ncbi:hypothetical protein [Micromonospora sp. HUAS LYJ1]|uniref:hypothetical protein n=1 Tax=Micromonospora sp. HUAS LYJ1 TaxID=3061626 RepID=UPI002673DCE3|nr:hypothetical protein [Micromonospora sp. HUAS LYJ1]WKU03732.1 hypothetical protein Q2K16_23250 [Micromonospora sp. HUAS LYJ1]
MDRPAPQHSDALNRMVGIPPEPLVPAVKDIPDGDLVDPAEYEQARVARRRAAAGRARRRRMQAA